MAIEYLKICVILRRLGRTLIVTVGAVIHIDCNIYIYIYVCIRQMFSINYTFVLICSMCVTKFLATTGYKTFAYVIDAEIRRRNGCDIHLTV
jgi:hypothetical protein